MTGPRVVGGWPAVKLGEETRIGYLLPMSISDLEVDKFDGNIEIAVSRIQNPKSITKLIYKLDHSNFFFQ